MEITEDFIVNIIEQSKHSIKLEYNMRKRFDSYMYCAINFDQTSETISVGGINFTDIRELKMKLLFGLNNKEKLVNELITDFTDELIAYPHKSKNKDLKIVLLVIVDDNIAKHISFIFLDNDYNIELS